MLVIVSDHYQFAPPSNWLESAGPASAQTILAFKLRENLACIVKKIKSIKLMVTEIVFCIPFLKRAGFL
jgi:hypothetical protein